MCHGAATPPLLRSASEDALLSAASVSASLGQELDTSGRQADCSSPFYYHSLRFLLVGDSDVGKNEILEKFQNHRLPLVNQKEVEFKTTLILLDGKRVKLQLW